MPPPSGIVGWWPGNGNGNDLVGGNDGTLVDVTFTSGVDGEAFVFDFGQNPGAGFTGVRIPDQTAYLLTNSLSIEGWIRPTGDGYVIFWRGDNRTGFDPYSLVMQGNNVLGFTITDGNNNMVSIFTPLFYNQWWHVAGTLDGGTGTMSLYTNGVLAVQTNTTVRPLGSLNAADSPGIGIGNVNDGANNFPFTGDINQISLYNRALSQGEIQAIYNAGTAGKCPVVIPPPPCLPHPATATATVVNGFVVGATIIDGGCGYASAPAIVIQGVDGTGAKATAVVSNGVVVGITIDSAGAGYSTPPLLSISPPTPPQTGVIRALIPTFSDLVTGASYQLQMSGDLQKLDQLRIPCSRPPTRP